MRLPLKKIDKQIEKLSLETVMLDAGNIPQLGETVKSLESIEALVKNGKKSPLAILTLAMRQYVEGVIMGETSDLAPFESGVSRLQEVCRNLIAGKKSGGDIDVSTALAGLEGSNGASATEEDALVPEQHENAE